MRVLIQRVRQAQVQVDGQTVGRVDHGLLLLTGIGQGDTPQVVHKMAQKVAALRIFSDEQGKFNLSLLDVRGGALVVSQFTLYADARKGRRPNYLGAAPPDLAGSLCHQFAQDLQKAGVAPVATGQFGAHMLVSLVNDGPVTIWLDSAEDSKNSVD
ncbi:MAG: D-tyrosyl-tRNA(Tyr) deacylase [Phycisphaeraceae bacterium]|nr:D-tyrosyl-tRNA(Tyr) deacylase [Phycisphaeraceae bacterium]